VSQSTPLWARASHPGMTPVRLISPALAGEANRARVIQLLYELGPLSRADLARAVGVGRATIGAIVQPMLDDGLLSEGPPAHSGTAGGKPARPLWFSSGSSPVAAVHLMPGRVEAALVSAAGDILASSQGRYPAAARRSDGVLDCIVQQLTALLPVAVSPVLGIGIAVGGMVDTRDGSVIYMNLAPALSGVSLAAEITCRIGIPARVDMHPIAQAIGDRWFGLGRGLSSFASVYVGEAIGAGLVLQGTVHRGYSGAGGEAGHSVVDANGTACRCGKRGCWETIASQHWLRREAEQRGLPGARRLTAGNLARLAASGRPAAHDLMDLYASNIALGLANVQELVAPGRFILHGDVVTGGEALRSLIEHRLRDGTLRRPNADPSVTFSGLDDRATLLGAAGLFLLESMVARP